MGAAIGSRIGLGPVIPVDLRVREHPGEAGRQVDVDVAGELAEVAEWPVVAAGLEQDHAFGPVGGQAIRQHAAGRAGPDDDEVRLKLAHPLRPLLACPEGIYGDDEISTSSAHRTSLL